MCSAAGLYFFSPTLQGNLYTPLPKVSLEDEKNLFPQGGDMFFSRLEGI